MTRQFPVIPFFSFSDGDVFFVAKRLDARYDWLPSPYTLKTKHPKTKLLDYGDGCSFKKELSAASSVIVVSRKGKCSFFEKVIVFKAVVFYLVSIKPQGFSQSFSGVW